MFSVLEFGNITSKTYAEYVCDPNCALRCSPVYKFLLFGVLPMDECVTPSYTDKTITAGMKNRYLRSIYVKRIPKITMKVNLAVGATVTFNIDGVNKAVSSDPSFATATVSDNTVTITGVAAGTTVVNVTDVNSDIIATITVTVA